MNISWGIRIAALYIGFVLLIGTLVFKSMNEKVDLVSDDYYARELKFQESIDARSNASSLPYTIEHHFEGGELLLRFPEQMPGNTLSGEVIFFRPSDSGKDFRVKMKPDTEGIQRIPLSSFERGLYKMQFEWKQEGKVYFSEESIFVP